MNRRVDRVTSFVIGSMVLLGVSNNLMAEEVLATQPVPQTSIEITPNVLSTQVPPPQPVNMPSTPAQAAPEGTQPSHEATAGRLAGGQAPAGGETMLLPVEKIGEQGSWVKKRKWIEQALPLNNESQEAIVTLEKDQRTFNDKFAEIQAIVDVFYRQTGYEQGKIGLLFTDVENFLEKRKKKQIEALALQAEREKEEKEVPVGFYDLKAVEIEEKASDEKRALEQLSLDVKAIEELNNSLTERIKKVDEELIQVAELAATSRKQVDEMWYIIDDQKAKQSFYELKNINEKIKNIVQYIGVDLTQDFATVIDRVKEQIEKIKKSSKELEEKGYIIENRMKRVEVLRKEKQEKLKAAEAEEAKVVPVKKSKEKPTAWYLWPIVSVSNYVGDGVSYIFTHVKSLLGLSHPIKAKKNKKETPSSE